MPRYKQREFDVDAEQFLPKVGERKPENVICYGDYGADDACYILALRLNWVSEPIGITQQTLSPGDWIVRSNRGEVYRISDVDFHRTYYIPSRTIGCLTSSAG